MSQSEHIKRHIDLHTALDELAADYLVHNPGRSLGGTSIIELLLWSHEQTQEPAGEQNIQELKKELVMHLN